MVNPELLVKCETAIKRELGPLVDLPEELGNTVANIYYHFFLICDELEQNPGTIPSYIPREKGFLHAAKKFNTDLVRYKSFYSDLPSMISHLRGIDKSTQPRLYRATVDLLLDILKYNISDAPKKTGLRRKLERVFRRSSIQEIPDLLSRIER